MRKFTANEIIAVMQSKGYKLYYDGSTNLIGVRSNNTAPNSFDDALYDIRFINGTPVMKYYQITTDPGTPNLLKPLSPNGCAILKPGQYRSMWSVGKHKGKYDALVQVKPCTVLRDYDKDNALDFSVVRQETGLFGINCHKATNGIISKLVGAYSAGCQVHADANRFDNEFMGDMKSMAQKYGNSFTYTLLTERDFN
jgi:hypothetical protein